MTDLAKFGTVLADEGVDMIVIDLRSGRAVKNDDGSSMSIRLLGKTSTPFLETVRVIQENRAREANNQPAGVPPRVLTEDETFAEDTMILCACTVGWNVDEYAGTKPFPWTPSNARRLWSDQTMRWLRRRALDFILQDANFLAPGSTSSETGQDTSSASTSPSLAVVQSGTP